MDALESASTLIACSPATINYLFYTTVTVFNLLKAIYRVAAAPDSHWPGHGYQANSVEFYTERFLKHLYLKFFTRFTDGDSAVPPAPET